MRLALIGLAACAHNATSTAPATTGEIAGVVRDHDSNDPVEQAIIRIAGREVTSDAQGAYRVAGVAPGMYTVAATFAGQPLEVAHVSVSKGHTSYVDLEFTLGRVEPLRQDWAVLTQIERFAAKGQHASIEGAISEIASHQRIAGAVVTAVHDRDTDHALQTISDDQGRFRFDDVSPGVYVISTYYSVGGRGQIEVRRSDIQVDAGSGVRVPLWIESTR
jgi:Carboxypeptidase regulatory-like domain